MELQKIQKINTVGLCSGYQADIKQFMAFSGGSFSAAAVKAYFEDMEARGLKASTMQRHRSALKKALLVNMGNGVTLAAVAQVDQFFKTLKIAKPEQAKQRDDMLSPGELKRLVMVAGPRTALIIRALYQTAARVSELAGIRIEDCRETPEGVKIRVIGKGKKERSFFMRSDTFRAILDTYQGETYLFETSPGRHISRHTISTMIKRAVQKIGRGDSHPHTFRHSWASINIETSGLAAVAAYLGHSDTSTTARYYLHGKPSMSAVLASAVI